MTGDASSNPPLFEIVQRFAFGGADDSLTDEQWAEFEKLLRENDEACRLYASYVDMSVLLPSVIATVQDDDLLTQQDLFLDQPQPALVVPFGLFAGAIHGAVGYFSQEAPFGFLMATLLTGLLLLGLWLTPASRNVAVKSQPGSTQPADLAQNGNDAKTEEAAAKETTRKVVGRITGEVDCSWRIGLASGERKLPVLKTNGNTKSGVNASHAKKQGADAPRSPSVRFGDRLTLASGLLEITYDTGAKVILEGPCTFNVETNGGFLAVGRLTGKMGKGDEGRRARGEGEKVGSGQWAVDGKVGVRVARGSASEHQIPKSQNPEIPASSDSQSLIPNPFVIATPTAIVTDLGTEFGVEVDEKRMCHVETFVGLVSVTPISDGVSKKQNPPMPLPAGQALRVSHGGVITKTHAAAVHFARRMTPQPLGAYAKLVLDDKPLAYWQLNEPKYAAWVVDRSGHHATGRLRGATLGVPGVSTDRPRAAEFSGGSYIETDELPECDFSQGYTIEAWVRLEGGDGTMRYPLAYRQEDHGDRTGFALCILSDGRWTCPSGVGNIWASLAGPPAASWQWTHVVATFSPTKKLDKNTFWGVQRLYINGRLAAHGQQPWKPAVVRWATIGAAMAKLSPGDFFVGRVADAAIYTHPLDADRIRSHWEAGRAADSLNVQSMKEKSNASAKK